LHDGWFIIVLCGSNPVDTLPVENPEKCTAIGDSECMNHV